MIKILQIDFSTFRLLMMARQSTFLYVFKVTYDEAQTVADMLNQILNTSEL